MGVEFDWGKEVMVRALILKLTKLLNNRKVGREKSEQKIIVVGDNNVVIITGNK